MTDSDPRRLYSPRLLAAFGWYLKRYFARHFRAVRIAVDGPPPRLDRASILYANHASWWDPLVLLYLAQHVFHDRQLYGPIDARALDRYPWLRRLGLFGIEPGTMAGTRRFLRIGHELLDSSRCALAVTAQGGFVDARTRPVRLQRGVAALLAEHPGAQAVPVAIEYPFWNEREPEVLIRFGEPLRVGGQPVASVHAALEAGLTDALDRLAAAATSRDPRAFDILIAGRSGVGFWQDLPSRMRAWCAGRRFDASHAAIDRDSAVL